MIIIQKCLPVLCRRSVHWRSMRRTDDLIRSKKLGLLVTVIELVLSYFAFVLFLRSNESFPPDWNYSRRVWDMLKKLHYLIESTNIEIDDRQNSFSRFLENSLNIVSVDNHIVSRVFPVLHMEESTIKSYGDDESFFSIRSNKTSLQPLD